MAIHGSQMTPKHVIHSHNTYITKPNLQTTQITSPSLQIYQNSHLGLKEENEKCMKQ